MNKIAWGPLVDGVRFGIAAPDVEVEAGGTIRVQLLCSNSGDRAVHVFGFRADYPRSLRVSPPKADRPFIRVSFADANVLHAPDAFIAVSKGTTVTTELDLSFVFDRRGVGRWPLAFAYTHLRATGGFVTFAPPADGTSTGVTELFVTLARSLRESGIDANGEASLDTALLCDDPALSTMLGAYGDGGAAFLARRVARVLSPGSESTIGWRAFHALARMGSAGIEAATRAREEVPHAATALDATIAWTQHLMGHAAPPAHLPFATQLEQIIYQPEMRGNFFLSWTAYESAVHGARRVELMGNGQRIISTRTTLDDLPRVTRGSLSEGQVRMVLEALRGAAVWSLSPLRQRALPDEPMPTLDVRLALGNQFHRQVAMLNGEWRQGPGTFLAALLDRLADERTPLSQPPPR